MKTIETIVYEYDELTEEAKQKARDWYLEGALDYDWWESIYEDAANIGLKITGFDLDRNRRAAGRFEKDAQIVAVNIMQEHGDKCDTFKTAEQFIIDRSKLNVADDDYDDKVEALEREFERSLLEDYAIMLQREMEWLTSDEQIVESIKANEYTFTASGKRMG